MEKVYCRFAAEERRLVRGLAVFVGAHTHTCCVRPGLKTARLGLSSWPARYLLVRENRNEQVIIPTYQ